MEMGEKIYNLRTKKGLTLEELGNMVGVGKSTVRKWEKGMIANMRRDKISKLANALNTTPAYLMGWSENPPDDPVDVPKNDDVRLLIRGLNKLSPEQLEQATNMMKIMFAKYADYFEKENDNDA